VDSFELAWDPMFAWDRESAGTSYPEEHGANEAKTNGERARPASCPPRES
jgi:hypothetical protein